MRAVRLRKSADGDDGGDECSPHRRRTVQPRTPDQRGLSAALRRARPGVRAGAGRHRQDLSRRRHGACRCCSRGKVERIVLSRPAVEAGERLGFLPGDMKEKVDPYLRPLYDALHDMLPAEQIAKPHRERARSRSRRSPSCAAARWRIAFVILDEAQNTTPMQMKMFLTRLGENSRMVVTGDPSQTDLPPGSPRAGRRGGQLDGVQGIAVVRFDHSGHRPPSAGDRDRPRLRRRSRPRRVTKEPAGRLRTAVSHLRYGHRQ